MAKIGSTDLALVTARVRCCRLGAARLGFVPWDVKGPGATYPCEYMWREVKPPTTQWTLLTEGAVCGKRPVASFSNVLCNAVGPVSFTDTSTPAEQITFWYWDFGDGGTSNDQNPTHTYAAGFYTVTLYVSGDKGTSSATGYVSVMSALVASADPNPTSVGVDVTFTPTFTGGLAPYTYKWAFEVDTLWADLIHAWSLDEPSGTRYDCLDSKDLAEVGTVGTIAGAYGDAADFTGGYITNAVGPSLSDDFTISLWFKAPVHPTGLLSFVLQMGQISLGLIQHRFYAEVDGWAAPHAAWPAGAVDDGAWHHAVVWVDTATDMFIHCSVDGGAATPSAFALAAPHTPVSNRLYVGSGDGILGTPTGLYLQRIAWFDAALTAPQRAALYTGQFYGSGVASPVYAYPTAGAKVASLTVTSATGCTITDTVDVTVSEAFDIIVTVLCGGNPIAACAVDVTLDGGAVWKSGVSDINGEVNFGTPPPDSIEVTLTSAATGTTLCGGGAASGTSTNDLIQVGADTLISVTVLGA